MSEEEIIDNIKFVLRDLTADRYNVNFVNSIKGLLVLYQKEKEEIDNEKRKNRILKDLIIKIRGLSTGVVNKENGYFGPRKNFTKQDLYNQFYNIKCLVKANYVFLDDEKFIEELEEKDEDTFQNKQISFKTLLNLIEKLQKENDENIKALEEWINGERVSIHCIHKDRIRAKIEEIKNICKNCRYKGEICKDLNNHNCCVPGLTLKSLKELLEK